MDNPDLFDIDTPLHNPEDGGFYIRTYEMHVKLAEKGEQAAQSQKRLEARQKYTHSLRAQWDKQQNKHEEEGGVAPPTWEAFSTPKLVAWDNNKNNDYANTHCFGVRYKPLWAINFQRFYVAGAIGSM